MASTEKYLWWEHAADRALARRNRLDRAAHLTADQQVDRTTLHIVDDGLHVSVLDDEPDLDPWPGTAETNRRRGSSAEDALDRKVTRQPPCPTCHLHGPCDC